MWANLVINSAQIGRISVKLVRRIFRPLSGSAFDAEMSDTAEMAEMFLFVALGQFQFLNA